MASRYHSLKRVIQKRLSTLRPIYDAWMRVITAINWVLVRVLLTVIFFTVFFAYGIFLRVFRRDPLKRRSEEGRESYWGSNVVMNESLDRFRKQY